jgi:HAE1 family hydrophobic/amphiphilic exporter-1
VLLNPDERTRLDHLNEIPILTPRGSTIRLGQVAQVATVTGPTQISRRDRQRSVTVSAGLDGTPSGEVSQRVQAGLDAIKVPAGYTVSQGGDAQDQGEAFLQIFRALGLLALVGAFGLLALTGNTLNLMILLTGLVGKNAILLVDYTNHLRHQGMARNAALLEAGPTRLRPILMTTFALILAMLPLAARIGEGGEWRVAVPVPAPAAGGSE